ncbi:MAG: SiaB family protein kinase [Salinivirgaceae bacterium]
MTLSQTNKIFEFKGDLTFPVIEEILNQIKDILQEMEIEQVVQKRLYAILVESLENALKHKTPAHKDAAHKAVELSLQQLPESLMLKIGNYMPVQKTPVLIERIKELNSLDLAGLNHLYRTSIANARISEKGGAGLGMIEIARSARNTIGYHIVETKNKTSFIVLEIEIATTISKN